MKIHDDMVVSINQASRDCQRKMRRHIAAFRAMMAMQSGENHIVVFSSDEESKEFTNLVRELMAGVGSEAKRIES